MKTPKFILLFLLISCCGCSILDNLDEISTLGKYSREKDAQHAYVKSINTHYDALLKAIDNGTINQCQDETAFERNFGDPILKKDLGPIGERWLYRYAIQRLAHDKVYVYFDHNGKMIKWERLPCPKLF